MRLEKSIDKKVAADRDLQERQQTFIEPENWPSNSLDLNSVDYSVGGGVATDGVSSHNFRQWPTETRANRLLGSAKAEHIEPSDRSAAKKIDDGYQSKVCPC